MRHKRRFIMAALEVNKHHFEKTEPADSQRSVQSLMGLKTPQNKIRAKRVLQDEKPTKVVEIVVVD